MRMRMRMIINDMMIMMMILTTRTIDSDLIGFLKVHAKCFKTCYNEI